MDRRSFVRLLAAAPLAPVLPEALPKLKVVSAYAPGAVPGMPGPYPGRVVSVNSERSVDTASNAANADVVREMMARGLCALTGERTAPQAWRRFFTPSDVVGIKVNCGGHPYVVSSYEIVAQAVPPLMALRIPTTPSYVHERLHNHLG